MNFSSKVFIFIATVVAIAAAQKFEQEGYFDHVTLYEWDNHKGRDWRVDLPSDDSCVEIPAVALLKVSSLFTNGNCVIMFQESNCKGRGVRFEDYTYGSEKFPYLTDTDLKHKSLRRCRCSACSGSSNSGGGTTPRYRNC